MYDSKVKVTYFELLCQIFSLEVFNNAYFPDHMMVGMMIDTDPRFNSAIIPYALANYLKVKVMDLELLC